MLEAILGVVTLAALGASFVAPEKHRDNLQGLAVLTGLLFLVILAAGPMDGKCRGRVLAWLRRLRLLTKPSEGSRGTLPNLMLSRLDDTEE